MVNVSMRSLIHHRVPDRIRGRVFAAYSGVLSTASAVATGLGGVFVETIGARGTLFLAGAGSTAVALVGAVLYRRLPLDQRTAAGSPRSR